MRMNQILAFILFALGLNAMAQTNMNIYLDNGTLMQIPLSTIDSITFTVGSPGQLATITTNPVSNITATTATAGGDITNSGGTPITSRGVCWNTAPNPTTANFITTNGTGTGSYTSSLASLLPSTTYYVRAYAINSAGTVYGSQVSFTTLSGVPVLTTTAISNVTPTGATSGGSITSDGGSAISNRGICWSLNPNPTIANNTTSNGAGTGSFASTISGLAPGSTYYVRAFATNGLGTVYGNELSFNTLTGVPVISTSTVSALAAVSAVSGGVISSDGGAAVISRGVCWSTSPGPTTANSTTSNGAGTGGFTSSLSGLLPSTTYYVRAYAVNSIGTFYGNELVFATTNGLAVLTTTPVTGLTSVSFITGGTITNDGGSPVTARGICWGTSPNPTVNDNTSSDGAGTGSFVRMVIGLIPNTTYYVRAYAITAFGTTYGGAYIVTTNAPIFTNGGGVTDINGNTYSSVVLGTQEWMATNLRVSSYANGDPIPQATDFSPPGLSVWVSSGRWGYGWGSNIPYGKMYNILAMSDPRNVCPVGWHVPSVSDWTTLTDYLGGAAVAGTKMKSADIGFWEDFGMPLSQGTNESGFNGLPAGYIDFNDFEIPVYPLGYEATWWALSGETISMSAGQPNVGIYLGPTPERQGHNVRCLKN